MKIKTLFYSLLFVLIVFVSSNVALASVSSGTITAPFQYAKVCHDPTCATTTGGTFGVINMIATGFTAITIDDTTGVSGQAWGNELGTITFNPIGGGVSINTSTGEMSGYAYASTGGWMKMNPSGVTPVTINCSGEWNGWAWIGGVNGGWVKFSASGITTPATPLDADATVKTDWRPTTCRPGGGGGIVPPSGGGGGGGTIVDQCPLIVGYQSSVSFCPVVPEVVPETPTTPTNPTTPNTPPVKTPPTKPTTPTTELPIFEVIGENPPPPVKEVSLIIKHILSESGSGVQVAPRFFDLKVTSLDPKDKSKKIITQEKGLFYEFVQSTNDHVSIASKNFVKTKVTFSYVGKVENKQRIIYQSRGFKYFISEFFNIQKISAWFKNIFHIKSADASEVKPEYPVSEFPGNNGSILIPSETGLYVMHIEGTNADGSIEVINVNSIVVPKGSVFYRWWWFGWHEKPIQEAKVTLHNKNIKSGQFEKWTVESNEEAVKDESYVFILPNGEYYLEISAPKFHTFNGESISLLANGHVINDKVELICTFWGSWWCLLPVKIVIVILVLLITLLVVNRRRRHMEQRRLHADVHEAEKLTPY